MMLRIQTGTGGIPKRESTAELKMRQTTSMLDEAMSRSMTMQQLADEQAEQAVDAAIAGMSAEEAARLLPPDDLPPIEVYVDDINCASDDRLQPEHFPPLVRLISQTPEPLNVAAMYGLAGDIVRAIEPHTEGDSAAILLQILVAFGALVGRGPHVAIEGDQHHTNLFAVMVGDTGKGRKGTSWGRVRQIMGPIPSWPVVVSGLSSGEGLKWAVRDAITRIDINKKTKFTEEIEVDPGVTDKRLLVLESEFAQVLRQAARAGNTLSATIRPAWDTGTLRTLTKNDPVVATGAHICIIGHITADELRADLTATDTANGFANRYIFMHAARSKVLPFGGDQIDEGLLQHLRHRIAQAADRARMLGAVAMTPAARDAWVAVYPTLSEGAPGLFGAVTARAEAQCIRLALIYALLDSVDVIDQPHLTAALAVWERAEQSARNVFGASLGDPTADEILRALHGAGSVGLTRTEISRLFKGHKSTERIGAALELLKGRRLAHALKRQTNGAPAEIWVNGHAKYAK